MLIFGNLKRGEIISFANFAPDMNSGEFFVVWGRPQAMLTLPGAGEDQLRYVVPDFPLIWIQHPEY